MAKCMTLQGSPPATIIHSTRHVVLSFGRVQELKNRFRLDEYIVRENDLVIPAVLHQGFQDAISKSRKEADAIHLRPAVRLRDCFVIHQYTPLYLHGVQSIVELSEQCWRLVIASALENGDEDVICAEVMDSFDDAVGPIRYDVLVIVKHGCDK